VAIAAALAAVLLFATTAQAAYVTLEVITPLSTLGFTEGLSDGGPISLFLDNLSPGARFGAEPDPSNVTNAYGIITLDVVGDPMAGGTISFVPGLSSIGYLSPYPYFPWRDAANNIVSPPGGIPTLSQVGLEIYLDFGFGPEPGGGFANISGLSHGFGDAGTGMIDGGPALPWVAPGTYVAAGLNALMAKSGRQDLFGAVTDSINLATAGPGSTPFPSPFAGNFVSWDGTLLTIPLGFVLTFTDDGVDYEITTFGSLVATHFIPEPASMIMLGVGAIGLVGCCWRARKRRA
jgi:hypothetical protein